MHFRDVRQDWYRSNSLLPRLLRRSLAGRNSEPFVEFPRHWLPLFVWCGAEWQGTIPAPSEVALFHALSEATVRRVTRSAQRNGTLRLLVEATASCDPLLADALYILDQSDESLAAGLSRELDDRDCARSRGHRPVQISTWQSYGRPSIRRFELECLACPTTASTVALLPCSRARPYDTSRTHRRLMGKLTKTGHSPDRLHRVVVTALGVIPEQLWNSPVVLEYDAGVPDVYRLLCLLREYFRSHRYERVLDCLSFHPYSDLLDILAREGAIPQPSRVVTDARSPFYVRYNRVMTGNKLQLHCRPLSAS